MNAMNDETTAGRDTMNDKHEDRQRNDTNDERRLRQALDAHPWPTTGDRLMAQLRSIPHDAPTVAAAEAQVAEGGDNRADAERRGESQRAAARQSAASRRSGGPRFAGPRRGWLEAAGAIAVAAAVVFVLVRGTGLGIAPADAPGVEPEVAPAVETPVEGSGAAATPPPPTSDAAEAADATEADGAMVENAVPLPPEGTRLYASVAELLAEPPQAGKTVWLDAYHGEIYEVYPGWGMGSSVSGCPSIHESPLLDRPHLLQLAAFFSIWGTTPPDPDLEPMLIAASVDEDGNVSVEPRLPRHGRLVLHLGDPAMDHCEEAERIAVVERVAHVFEEKADGLARRAEIRNAETNGEMSGSTLVTNPDGGADIEIGGYRIAIPKGLQHTELGAEEENAPDAATGLALPELLQHPIHVERYMPEHPQLDEMFERIDALRAEGPAYPQRIDNAASDGVLRQDPLEFVLGGLGPDSPEVEALTVVDDIVYRIAVTLPPDPFDAQPLLWWFEEVVDRFRIEEPADSTAVAGEAPVSEMTLLAQHDFGYPVETIAVREDWAIVGGLGGLTLLHSDKTGLETAMLPYAPPSPTELGLVRDGDVERAASQLGIGIDAARAMLDGSDDRPWRVQALEVRAPYAYAVLEWPAESGLAWLHVIEFGLEQRPVPAGAARLGSAEGTGFQLVDVSGLALYGDRLLGASTVGLFDIDVSEPSAPLAPPPREGQRSMMLDIAVSPEDDQAWVTDPLIDAGGLRGIDLRDPMAPRLTGIFPGDVAFFDLVSDGVTAYVTHGAGDGGIRIFDVRQRGIGPMGSLPIPVGSELDLALGADRLYVATTDVGTADDVIGVQGAYPGPGSGAAVPGILIYDVSIPGRPTLLGAETLPSRVNSLAVDGPFLMAAIGESVVRIYTVGEGDAP